MADNADIADLNPAFRARLDPFLAALDKAGIKANVISGYRSPEQQAEIYTRSHQGRDFAAGSPWRSFHNYGLAADITPANPDDYPRMWDMAEQFGITPLRGYDKPHFQMAGSLSDNIDQFNLANWRPASHPAPAEGAIAYVGGQPSHVGTPTPGQPAPFNVPANAPMGMRNNNPLNIKYYPGASYEGLVGPSANTDQGDPQMVFKTPEAGWAAAYSLLNKKYASGMTTPNMIIAGQGGWTPGNKQAALNVAKAAGIGPDDDIGFSDPAKAQRFMRALVQQEQGGASSAYPDTMIAGAVSGKPIGTTLNTSGGPTLAAGGPSAPSGAGGLAGALPGFQAGSPGAKMTAGGLQSLFGGKGGGQEAEPPPMPMGPAPPPAMAAGGPMMLGPGGQNLMGRVAPQNAPALMAHYMAAPAQPMLAPGAATGMPGLPGTTLNSPSQLQMALMTGNISPYDLYANPAAAFGGGGFGSA